MNAVVAILAGGQGTRLAARSGNLPKPMVSIMGKPVLQHQIELCRTHGFLDIALLVHYRHETISDHFGDGSAFGVRIRYCIESFPRGTSGALRDALPSLAEQFLVLYGDTYVDVDLRNLWDAHVCSGCDATLFLHPNDHPHDSDLVEVGRNGQVRAILPYPRPPGTDHRNLVNAALYVLNRKHLADVTPAEGKEDIAKHMFPAMLAAGRTLHGHVTPEYIKDMGTPERLDKVARDIEFGLAERLSVRSLRSAVFLDRDGTLNEEVHHLQSVDDLKLIDHAAEAVRRLNRDGKLAIVVTNQPVVARGDVSEAKLEAIHARLETLLGQGGAYLDGLYVCPHHPDRGFPGEIEALKIRCTCRKPAPGLIERACADLQVNRTDSWMVGDTTSDIEAGRQAGVRTVLVRTGHAGGDDKYPLRPDYVMPALAAAVEWILHGHRETMRRVAPLAHRMVTEPARLVLVGGLARSGKSTVAQVLKESLVVLGATAHVLSLDSWLKPEDQRPTDGGVLARYDTMTIKRELVPLATVRHRRHISVPVYDRSTLRMLRHAVNHSVGASDILIIEGVVGLLVPELVAAASMKVFVEVPEAERLARFTSDYAWRGRSDAEIRQLFDERNADETATVLASRSAADFIIPGQAPIHA